MRGRPIFVFIIFFAFYAVVSARLYVIQVHDQGLSAFRIVQSEASRKPLEVEEASVRLRNRGQIFFTDKSGSDEPVVMTKEYPLIFVSPKDVENPTKVATMLSPIVGIPREELAENIAKRKEIESEYFPLLPRASEEAVTAVTALGEKGISIENSPGRFYPYKNLASQVIGFMGMKGDVQTALYGVEQYYDKELSEGKPIHLTINIGVQDYAEDLLEKLITDYGATGGTIIVQSPRTGEIVAMTSKPDFDPNRFSESEIKNFLNPAVQLIYEPGSVIKPLTLSAGIDTGKLTPETTFTDTGSLTLNGMTIHNFEDKVYGTITMREMIQNSVNTGAAFAERATGPKVFYEYLKNYGLTEKTGIGLPGEVSGNLRNLVRKDVRAIDFATAAYGQGISMSPLTLISAYSAIANGGVLMKPIIIKGEEPHVVRRVIKEETAKTITDILASSVVKNRVASIPGYHVAGKTGTAFIADPSTGRYSEEMIHTFVGYAPATNPEFVILVKMERPAHGEAAGQTVVSTFKKLAEFLLQYYHAPPDDVSVQP